MRILGVVIFWSWAVSIAAQIDDAATLSSWRVQTLAFADSIALEALDSLTIWPSSLVLTQDGRAVADSLWRVDAGYLHIASALAADSIRLRYRVWPFGLTRRRKHKDSTLIGQRAKTGEILYGDPYAYNPKKGTNEAQFKDLQYSGSFARGLSVGNAQDLVLNSSFNLQLGGMLGDVEVTGAISDNNIPLQPEGNTQQLQDFDRLYIQFKRGRSRLLVGDYALNRPEGAYFLNYQKQLQGVQFETGGKVGQGDLSARGSFALSRGKFGRNTIEGQEGNQGPYRLRGNNGEQFIIILAGTERVFIDGQLMVRGTDRDYTIDYNQGEVRFTANRLITKDARIQIEFEYSDLNYVRTLYATDFRWKKKNMEFGFNMYSEQDAKNQATQEDLSDEEKLRLAAAGDDLTQAFSSGATLSKDGFDPNLIQYRLTDSTMHGFQFDSVFVYTTRAADSLYTVRFAQVGAGKGHYEPQAESTANGRVFVWVGVDAQGNPAGSYAPLIQLVPPQKRQLYNAGVTLPIGKTGKLHSDIGLSVVDENTFSEKDAGDNAGVALRLTYEDQRILAKRKVLRDSIEREMQTTLGVGLHYELLNRHFQAIEPYRLREFARDWNLPTNTPNALFTEQLAQANIQLGHTSWGRIGYQFNTLWRDSLYRGIQHEITARNQYKGLQLIADLSYLESESTNDKSTFWRPKVELSQRVGALRAGIYLEREQNRRFDLGTDTLASTSFYYDVARAFIEMPKNAKGWSWKTQYQRRWDYTPQRQVFTAFAQADEAQIQGAWSNSQSTLTGNFNYRQLQIIDSTATTQTPKETYLGRLQYGLTLAKGFIRSNTTYELGSGQQPRVEYSYLEVDQGQGTHVWIDRNEDGAQQQDEFEQANFQDQANYLRVTTQTTDFIRSNNVVFNQTLSLQPRRLLRKAEIWPLKLVQRLASQTVVQIDRKTLENANVLPFNPFALNVADSGLVTLNSSFRQSFYFNRSSPKFGLEWTIFDARNKNVLNNGFETRRRSSQKLAFRQNISQQFTWQLDLEWGQQNNKSELFEARNYEIDYQQAEPKLTYLYKRTFRASVSYRYLYRLNTIRDKERALSHRLSTELTYSQSSKTNIRLNLSLTKMDYRGARNTPVEFALLEGLENGQNYLWTLSVDRALTRTVQLTLSYEGRKTGDVPIVHVGRAQVRALF